MLTGMELMSCPNLAVPAEVMRHIVHVESSANPFAIGVVGGQLVRQPQDLAEALATVRMLDNRGYDYSLGIAQVHRANLGRYGLDTYTKAFDTCANLAAGAHILADCYARAKGDWGDAFSCYYSGNFSTGYRDGYVQKVYASIGQATGETGRGIPLAGEAPAPANAIRELPPTTVNGAPGYLAALRSVAIDTAGSTIARATLSSVPRTSSIAGKATGPAPSSASAAMAATTGQPPLVAAESTAARRQPAAFTPRVHGPHDGASPAPVAVNPIASTATTDPTNAHQDPHDAAFVF